MSNQFHYLSSFWLFFFFSCRVSARFQFRAVRERESSKVLEKESFSNKVGFQWPQVRLQGSRIGRVACLLLR